MIRYIKALDGIRGLAIMLVLLHHFAWYIGGKFDAGYYGVDLFFVLSGFLITGILLNGSGSFSQAFGNFLGRRAIRIFPVYYLTIAILLIAGVSGIWKYLPFLLTYTYNYAIIWYDIPVNPASHFWSLCIEEQFYLVWPLFVLSARKSKNFLFALTSILVLVCGLQLGWKIIPSVSAFNYHGIFPRAYSLLIGALGSFYCSRPARISPLQNSRLAEVLLLVLVFSTAFFPENLRMLIFPWLAVLIIIKAWSGGFAILALNTFLENSKLRYLGKISYGIYVYHLPIGLILTYNFFNPYVWNKIDFESWGRWSFLEYHSWVVRFPLYSGLSILVAHFSYQYFEKPLLALKERYFRR